MVGLNRALLLPSLILGLDKSLFEIVSCQDNEAQLKTDSGVETASCQLAKHEATRARIDKEGWQLEFKNRSY